MLNLRSNIMKLNKIYPLIVLLIFSFASFGQEDNSKTKKEDIDIATYYEQRAKQDAEFEQNFRAESKAEERKFWKQQKRYERELRRRDREAYHAYMQGKHDAYMEHHANCHANCYHGYYYRDHAHYYMYGYYGNHFYYHRYPRNRSTIRTNVRVNSPRIRLGVF